MEMVDEEVSWRREGDSRRPTGGAGGIGATWGGQDWESPAKGEGGDGPLGDREGQSPSLLDDMIARDQERAAWGGAIDLRHL